MPWLPSTCSSSAITRSIGTVGPALRRRQQADLHVPAARAQAADRVLAGDRRAPSASSETCAPPPVSSATAAGDVARAPSTRVLGAELAGQLQRAGGDVDGDHPGAGRGRDLHRRQPDPAAAVHRHPLPRAARAPTCTTARKAVAYRQPRRGRGRRGPARRAAATRLTSAASSATNSASEPQWVKPGWVWRAHTCCSPAAHCAQRAAGVDERHGHPVARAPSSAPPLADRGDRAGQLVTGHVRQDDVGVVPLPGVPVAAADARWPPPARPRRRPAARGAATSRTERTAEESNDQCRAPRIPALPWYAPDDRVHLSGTGCVHVGQRAVL